MKSTQFNSSSNLQFKDLSSMLKLWNNQCGGKKKKWKMEPMHKRRRRQTKKNKNGMHKVMKPIHKRRRLWNSWPIKFKDPNKYISKILLLVLILFCGKTWKTWFFFNQKNEEKMKKENTNSNSLPIHLLEIVRSFLLIKRLE